MNSPISAPFQHMRQSARSPALVTGRPAQFCSAVPDGDDSRAQFAGKPRVVMSGAGHEVPIFACTEVLTLLIFKSVAASGHGPGIFPRFSLSRHLPSAFSSFFLNLSRFLMICFWQFTGSARTDAAETERTTS